MKTIGQSKFIRYLITVSLLALSVTVANGAMGQNSNACVKSVAKKSKGGTVYFENNSSKLTKSAKKALKNIANKQKDADVIKVEITGFVSAVGPSSKHKSLAQARAESVKNYFTSQGLNVDFVTKGVGVTSTKSTSSKARKATVQVINMQQIDTGGKVPVVKIEQGSSFTATVGVPVSYKVAILDAAAKADTANPTTFSISPDLPKGLSMDNKTGEITGTPTEQHRLVKYTITAKNNCGSDSVSFEMSISPAGFYLGGYTPTGLNCGTGEHPNQANTACEPDVVDIGNCNENSPSGLAKDPEDSKQHGCDGIGDNHGMPYIPNPTSGSGVSPSNTTKVPEPVTQVDPPTTYNGKSDIPTRTRNTK